MRLTRRTLALPAAGLCAALLLSSCGQTSPGAAAEVDGTTISRDEVDDFAEVLCALASSNPQQSGPVPATQMRAQSLDILLGIEVGRRVGDVDAVDQRTISQQMQSVREQSAQIPEQYRALFLERAEEFSRSEAAIAPVLAASLRKQGKDPNDPAGLQAERARLVAEYLATHDAEIDPRFGSLEDGAFQPGEGSLSFDVSGEAAQEDPAAEASALPASQQCS